MRGLGVAWLVLLLLANALCQAPPPKAARNAKPGSRKIVSVNVLTPTELKRAQADIQEIEKVKADPAFADSAIQAALNTVLLEKRCQVGASLLAQSLRNSHLDARLTAELLAKYSARCEGGEPQPLTGSAAPSSPVACELPSEIPASAGTYQDPGLPPPATKNEINRYPVMLADSIYHSGNQVVGPRSIRVTYINPLRFDVALGSATTLQSGQQLPAGLVPALSSLPAPPSPKVVPAARRGGPSGLDAVWNAIWDCHTTLDRSVSNVEATINTAIGRTNDTTSHYTAVLNRFSAKLLTSGEVTAIQSAVQDKVVFADYYHFTWPTAEVNTLTKASASFADRFAKFSQLDGYGDWIKDLGNKQSYDYIQSRITDMRQHLANLGPSSDTANRLRSAQDTVEMWRQRFNAVQVMANLDFKPGFDVDCDTWFGRSKTVAVRLVTRDVLGQAASSESVDLVTVVCNSRLTVSTGVGFAVPGDKTPAFVAGKDAMGAIVNQLGFSSDSAASPIYSFQINSSIKANASNSVELHGSIGAVVTTGSSTSTVGFLIGPSLSFIRRTFFLTPSLYLVQRTELLPGFSPGDPQGTLTSPPTKQSWRPSFATTITFPINP